MATAPTPYGYQPSAREKIIAGISKRAPIFIGKTIQFLMYWFVQLWRFVADAIREAIGR